MAQKFLPTDVAAGLLFGGCADITTNLQTVGQADTMADGLSVVQYAIEYRA
ncbi:MAG: hypothetical protein GX920_02795 [Micrococcus sp.]|nr:hypothetical protein [Micrococcus sp.]